jgi:hypothetical protein
MIRRTPLKVNPCNTPGCKYPRFSGGYCHKHQSQRKEYKKPKPIGESKGRGARLSRYKQACLEADQKYSRDGRTYCFFCEEFTPFIKDHHHPAGRTGENMFKGIIPCHPECHRAELGGWHSLTPENMAKKPYIGRYLKLLKETDEQKYNQLKRRIDNANNTEK